MTRFPHLPILAFLGLSAPLPGQDLDVAILGAERVPSLLNDVEAKLTGTGRFDRVDQVDVYTNTPSLATLRTYDAVLTWSDYDYQDSEVLGNLLADYVDLGGGVVVMVFANTETNPNRRLQGRWQGGGYHIFPSPSGTTSGQAWIGTRLQPDHPLLADVNSFFGGNFAFRGLSTTLSPGAQVVAEWTDGLPLVVVDESHAAPRVDLNFFPPSGDSGFSTYWDPGTDGDTLMANALEYAATGGVPELSFPDVLPGYLTFHIRRVLPGNEVVSLISHRGSGPTVTPFGEVQVATPWFQTPPFPADASGIVEFTTTLPAGTSGRTLYSQAVELLEDGTAEMSNPVELAIP